MSTVSLHYLKMNNGQVTTYNGNGNEGTKSWIKNLRCHKNKIEAEFNFEIKK